MGVLRFSPVPRLCLTVRKWFFYVKFLFLGFGMEVCGEVGSFLYVFLFLGFEDVGFLYFSALV